jgi:hypothetical protein
MSYCIPSRHEALHFCNEQGAWRFAITGCGRDEDGNYHVVDQVRCFFLEEQQQQPFNFREPFNDELFNAWEEECMEVDDPDSDPPDNEPNHEPHAYPTNPHYWDNIQPPWHFPL